MALALALAVICVPFHPIDALAVPGIASGDAQETPPSAELSQDGSKTLDEVLEEARELLRSGRPIDARAKMLHAVQRAPEDYRGFMLLGQYYLFEVAHFKLAYRYLKTAEKHFFRQYGSDIAGTLDEAYSPEHAMLLYLLSEAELNLDKYEDSLRTLDRFESRYWLDWYPGTRAWVLMKLKRVDEAIKVAQDGLTRDADPRRTWNILGILLSLKDNRELSLNAFQEAIKAELTLRGSGMIATPLNNAGEVYREMFEDGYAEAAFLRAIRLPDGCEHVLPSLNLANMYIDQLRLFQAERTLKDFESCFQQQTLRHDSEHRTLLALARGKIALHENRVEEAGKLVQMSVDDQQWFGKIGTNENDVKIAGALTMAQVFTAESAVLRDQVYERWWETLKARLTAPVYEVRAWWLRRKALRIALEELDNFEDLNIRNTDSMLEYPTLGFLFRNVNASSVSKRIERIIASDSRPLARTHYRLFLAENLHSHGEHEKAINLITQVLSELRPVDRLARAQALTLLLISKRDQRWFFDSPSESEQQEELELKHQIFELLPSRLRYHDVALPVGLTLVPSAESEREVLQGVADALLRKRFELAPAELSRNLRYNLVLNASSTASGKVSVTIQLMDRRTNALRSVETAEVESNGDGTSSLINAFLTKAFSHQLDPQSNASPTVPILNGLM